MRPIRLEISGLNSFRGKEVIDFEPLMRDGLFGIFGPTGSGKSSILDAMTLALYGKVKRAPLGKNGIINAQEERCVVSLKFEAGVGEARRTYIVERNLALSKTEGVSTKKVRLIEIGPDGSIPIAEKQGDVNSRIEEILGINVDDFLRAVVLPQGSFAEFLGLAQAERSKVLQRIFNLHDLGQKLAQKVKQEIATLKTSRAGIDGRLQELRAYDDQALERLRVAFAAAREELEEARSAAGIAERAFQEGRQLLELVEELERLREEEKGSEEKNRKLLELREKIEAAERSSAVEPLIAAYDRTVARHRRAQEELNAAEEEAKSGADALEKASSLLAERREEHEGCYDLICSQISILHQIEEERKELGAKRQRQMELDTTVAALDEEMVTRSEQRRQRVASLQTLEAARSVMEQDLKIALLSVDERESLDTLRRRQQDLKRLAISIAEREESEGKLAGSITHQQTELQEAVFSEKKSAGEMERIQKDLDALQRAMTELDTEILTLREEYRTQTLALNDLAHAEKQRDVLRVDLENENLAIERYIEEQRAVTLEIDAAIELERNAAARHEEVMEEREKFRNRLAVESLLHTLKDGEPCPLCGALEHPAPFAPEGSTDSADLDRMLAEADRLQKAASEEKAYSSQRMATVQVQLQGSRERSAAAAAGLEAIAAEIATLLGRIPGTTAVESIDELRLRVEAIKDGGVAKSEERKKLGERAEALARDLAGATDRRNSAARQISALEAGRSVQEVQLAEARAWLQQLRTERQEALQGLNAGDAQVTTEWIDSEVDTLLAREATADRLRQEISLSDAGIRQEREEADAAERELVALTSRREREQGVREQLRTEIAEITTKLRERHATVIDESEQGVPIADLITRRERRRDQVHRAYDDALAAHRTATVRVEVGASALERNRRRLDEEREEMGTTLDAMNQGLADHSFLSPEEARSGMIDLAELNRLRSETKEIAQSLVTLQERLREVEGRVAGRTITRSRSEQLEQEWKAARHRSEEAGERSGAARSNLETCQQGNADYHALLGESSEAMAKAETAERLQRYLQGDAFVGYLADERLAEICRRATVQLRHLTGGTYELRTRPNDGFYIIDNGNGGGERSPSSLSGGETFLVSLSLALSLSDMVQMGRSPLEFFFLDEGFGTLDSDLLDTVMNSLERLRSPHRTIGVITHVAALRERISRRLIVQPATEARGSKVEFELL